MVARGCWLIEREEHGARDGEGGWLLLRCGFAPTCADNVLILWLGDVGAEVPRMSVGPGEGGRLPGRFPLQMRRFDSLVGMRAASSVFARGRDMVWSCGTPVATMRLSTRSGG
jgi:hypothetical protein